MSGSNFCSWTRKPRATRRRPIDADAIPLPRAETTPPVTKRNLVSPAGPNLEPGPESPPRGRKLADEHGRGELRPVSRPEQYGVFFFFFWFGYIFSGVQSRCPLPTPDAEERMLTAVKEHVRRDDDQNTVTDVDAVARAERFPLGVVGTTAWKPTTPSLRGSDGDVALLGTDPVLVADPDEHGHRHVSPVGVVDHRSRESRRVRVKPARANPKGRPAPSDQTGHDRQRHMAAAAPARPAAMSTATGAPTDMATSRLADKRRTEVSSPTSPASATRAAGRNNKPGKTGRKCPVPLVPPIERPARTAQRGQRQSRRRC